MRQLRCGDADGDSRSLERNSGVEGVYVSTNHGHEVRLRGRDVHLAGRGTGSDGDVVRVAIVGLGHAWHYRRGDKWDGRGNGVGREVDDRDRAVRRQRAYRRATRLS